MATKNNLLKQSKADIDHGRGLITGYAGWPPPENIIKHLEVFANFVTNNVNGAKVLDIGCGDGSLTRLIAEMAPAVKVTGMDVKKHPHWKQHTKTKNLSFDTGSIYNLPYKSNSFDAVIIKDVLHHLPDPKLAIDSLLNVTKDGVLIIEANRYNPISYIRMVKIAKHEHFSLRKLKRTAGRNGKLVTIETHAWPVRIVAIGGVVDRLFNALPFLSRVRNYNLYIIEKKKTNRAS